jgi:ribonuclease BN (tRNA processing enzyme)
VNESRKDIIVDCLGTGDAFAHGARMNSCFHIGYADQQILFDCGSSALVGLRRAEIDPAALDAIVISHLHGDHFGGIPYLLLEAKYVSKRSRPLRLIGPSGLRNRVENLMEVLFPGTLDAPLPFPVTYELLEPARRIELGGAAGLSCVRVRHGSSDEVFGLRLTYAEKAVAYSGDTEWVESLVDLACGTELMIIECFGFEQQLASHLDYRTLLAKRGRLNSKRLALTHIGPEMFENLDKIDLRVLSDGDRIVL